MKSSAGLLELHARLVATRSVSGEEEAIANFVAAFLEERGAPSERHGNSLLAFRGRPPGTAPLVVLNSHLDTVPAAPGWTRDPWQVDKAEGRIYGLGSNDAKAAVAAMIAAFLALPQDLGFTVALALAEGEETKGVGSIRLTGELKQRGLVPAAVVVGEPTRLDVAIAQKGLLILELVEQGEAAHAAHAKRLGVSNAIRALGRDLVALETVDLGPEHPQLGHATCEPTMLKGGTARNVVPAEASVVLDVRTVPGEPYEKLVSRLQEKVEGEIRVLSDRLRPCGTEENSELVRCALKARPEAKLYGSPTLSDWVYFRDFPTIKVGPGDSDRSHRPDEYVLEKELEAGAAFYSALLAALGDSW
jgi:acetylornithine deacetylase